MMTLTIINHPVKIILEQLKLKLKNYYCDRLSQDILICLFEGEVKTIDISLKPEGLHFGFNTGNNDNLERQLRTLNGVEKDKWKVFSKITNSKVNITNLAEDIKKTLVDQKQLVKSFTSAQFALQMVQGAEKVRFVFLVD